MKIEWCVCALVAFLNLHAGCQGGQGIAPQQIIQPKDYRFFDHGKNPLQGVFVVFEIADVYNGGARIYGYRYSDQNGIVSFPGEVEVSKLKAAVIKPIFCYFPKFHCAANIDGINTRLGMHMGLRSPADSVFTGGAGDVNSVYIPDDSAMPVLWHQSVFALMEEYLDFNLSSRFGARGADLIMEKLKLYCDQERSMFLLLHGGTPVPSDWRTSNIMLFHLRLPRAKQAGLCFGDITPMPERLNSVWAN